MADKSRIYRLTVSLSDINRGIYTEIPITAARHPSETPAYLALRILAYIRHWGPGIHFGRGVCLGNEPAVAIREADHYRLWVEIGPPAAGRALKLSRLADRLVIYARCREAGRKLDKLKDISNLSMYCLHSETLSALVERLECKAWNVTLLENRVYLDTGGNTLDFEPTSQGQRPGAF